MVPQDILRKCRPRRFKPVIWFCISLVVLVIVIWRMKKSESEAEDVPNLAEAELLEYLLQNHLIPPAANETPYQLTNSRNVHLAHDEIHSALIKTLRNHSIETGFFVEAGALDGEYLSHTLELEMYQAWEGLLVEASPSLLPRLKEKRRKSWIADVCLTTTDNVTVEFLTKSVQRETRMKGHGRINPKEKTVNASSTGFKPKLHRSEGQVWCFKLGTLLKAINVSHVDLLVLDVEGHEYKILETYDFSTIPIKIIAVETRYMPESFGMLKFLMDNNGYDLEFRSKTDAIFVLK